MEEKGNREVVPEIITKETVDQILTAFRYSIPTAECRQMGKDGYYSWPIEMSILKLSKGILAYKLIQEANLQPKAGYYDTHKISNSEARQMIRNKSVRINGHIIEDEMQIIDIDYTINSRISNKHFFIIELGNRKKNQRAYTYRVVHLIVEDKDIIERVPTEWGEWIIFGDQPPSTDT